MNFDLTDKKTGQVHVYKMATSWMDVTAKQFYELREWDSTGEGAELKLISILSGCPYNLLSTSSNIDLDTKLLPLTNFLNTPIDKYDYIPTGIEIKGETHLVPKEINKTEGYYQFTLAQKNAMTQKFIKTINKDKDHVKSAPFIVACYYYPIVNKIIFSPDGDHFSSEKAEEFEAEIMNCKMIEVLAAYNFFLPKLTGSQIAKQPNLALSHLKNKYLRRLISWMFSRKLTPSTHLQAVTY